VTHQNLQSPGATTWGTGMIGEPSTLGEILTTIDRVHDRLVAVVVHLNDTYLLGCGGA